MRRRRLARHLHDASSECDASQGSHTLRRLGSYLCEQVQWHERVFLPRAWHYMRLCVLHWEELSSNWGLRQRRLRPACGANLRWCLCCEFGLRGLFAEHEAVLVIGGTTALFHEWHVAESEWVSEREHLSGRRLSVFQFQDDV